MVLRDPSTVSVDASSQLVTATGTAITKTLADWTADTVASVKRADATKNIAYAGAASSASKSEIFSRMFVSGVVLPDPVGQISPFTMSVNDLADATAGPHGLEAVSVFHAIGAGARGSRSAIRSHISLTGHLYGPIATPTDTAFVVSNYSSGFVSANQGGTGIFTTNPFVGGYRGSIWGGNDNVWFTGTATHMNLLCGREINVSIQGAASAFAKLGVLIAKSGPDASQAVQDDAAICIADQPLAEPWKHGIQFGCSWAHWPFNATSTVIGIQQKLYATGEALPLPSSRPAAYGIDFRDALFGTAAFASAGFLVDGDGDTRVKTLAVTDGVTAPGSVAGAAQIYVDTADGDLKVKFGDGVVKVLAADT